ncbi:MAG: Fur family transcriptional regulator [bacterium]
MNEEKVFKSYLKNIGLRFTPERKQILNQIFSIHEHFDVEKLYARLRRRKNEISRATIYRMIPHLVSSGLIKRVMRCREKDVYEHVFGHPHHDHLVCIKCGRVIEFIDEKIEALQSEVCKKYGFKSIEHRLGIRGYCSKCK